MSIPRVLPIAEILAVEDTTKFVMWVKLFIEKRTGTIPDESFIKISDSRYQ